MCANGPADRPLWQLPLFSQVLRVVNSLRFIAGHPEVPTLAGWWRWFAWQLREQANLLPIEVSLGQSRLVAERYCEISALVAWVGRYDYNRMNFLLSVAEKNDVFFDVGANVGSYSLLAAEKMSDGHVVAFEPDLVALRRWEKNRALNGYSMMEVHAVAVGDEDCTVAFPESNGAPQNGVLKGSKGRQVSMIRLDSFIRKRGIRPTILKIDTEGYEHNVLAGMGEYLGDPELKYVQFEAKGLGEETSYSFADTRSLLAHFGFRCFTYDHRSRTLSPIPQEATRCPVWDAIAVSDAWLKRWRERGILK